MTKQSIAITKKAMGADSVRATEHDLPLRQPIYLHVGSDGDGNNGIIGRRISLFTSSESSTGDCVANKVLAEGIVGFNSF